MRKESSGQTECESTRAGITLSPCSRNQLLAHNVGLGWYCLPVRQPPPPGRKKYCVSAPFFAGVHFLSGRAVVLWRALLAAQILRNDSTRKFAVLSEIHTRGGPREAGGNWMNFVRSSGIHVRPRFIATILFLCLRRLHRTCTTGKREKRGNNYIAALYSRAENN